MEKVNNLEESVIFFFREIVKNKIYVNYFLQSHNIWYYLFVVRILEKKRLLWKFQALKHFKSCAGYGIIPTEHCERGHFSLIISLCRAEVRRVRDLPTAGVV